MTDIDNNITRSVVKEVTDSVSVDESLSEILSPTQRRCIVSRDVLSINEMIRFVVSPDMVVTPDIKGQLPGRGMWVRSNSVSLGQAIKMNAFAKSAKAQLNVPENLVGLCESLLKKRIAENLSLARRAGFAISGFEKVKEIVKSHHAQIVFSSAGEESDSAGKLRGMCRMLEIYFFEMLSAAELGTIFGREDATYAGVKKCGIANTIEYEAKRLNLFQNGE